MFRLSWARRNFFWRHVCVQLTTKKYCDARTSQIVVYRKHGPAFDYVNCCVSQGKAGKLIIIATTQDSGDCFDKCWRPLQNSNCSRIRAILQIMNNTQNTCSSNACTNLCICSRACEKLIVATAQCGQAVFAHMCWRSSQKLMCS